MKKRSEWEIYHDILESLATNGSMKKTSLMHDIHMSWKPFNNHFGYLTKKGFIEQNGDSYKLTENGKELQNYKLTENGKELQKNLRHIKKTLR
ncbi:winged helix-turn-helix domain-containing protein [Methanonatronarchaeum sp. AMET6-2]|uniref:winged helix-turn-helix domain-containing protein n=1 Tax=Methanonatronarchaeum sp. AMET6-2 TaxID=2933293 RepID=UPI001FF1893D|nr:winged helix-turn-helix domain-containing protein [Methanonatronarchaeum sp. AMET6-2]UOY09387.1 winged helix-turn-helix domain-containing protein [Methanonatronarchaeum sp. AMET6-2]